MPRIAWRLAALGTAVVLGGATVALQASERSQQKAAAEAERATLRQKLDALKRDIEHTESAHGRASDALAHSEAAISDANRSLRQLAVEQAQTAAQLEALVRERAELMREVDAGKRQLGTLLREQYVAGNEDRIKLLLSGDNPNRINRELQYLGYVSQAQARLIEALRADLQGIEENQAKTRKAQEELDEIAQEQREQRALLEKQKAQRAQLLAQLSDKLGTQRRQAVNLRQDEERMAKLVDRLARLIEEQRKEEQRKAELARAEQRRQAAARAREEKARERERQQLARRSGEAPPLKPVKALPSAADAIDDDENPDQAGTRSELAATHAVQPALAAGSVFASLRGKLKLPLAGEVTARFGSARAEGPSWKGLFIRAPEGSEVKAVAGGRVVFAEWLRGFGNLIIVDHGAQYMTIYGNNQALLKRAGDAVKSGEAIASAGNSGGNEQSGLYFEMRHQGRAFDPLGWVTTR